MVWLWVYGVAELEAKVLEKYLCECFCWVVRGGGGLGCWE